MPTLKHIYGLIPIPSFPLTLYSSLAIIDLMTLYNFDPDMIGHQMMINWKGYYEQSYTHQQKSLYKIIRTFTHSRIRAYLTSSAYSVAAILFAKAKNLNKSHTHHKKKQVISFLTFGSFILLPTNLKKCKEISKLIYNYFLEDRIAHGYMTTLRDEAWAKVVGAIYDLPFEKFMPHSLAFSEAAVLLDPYEYHEVEDGPWDKVEEKLKESFRELKKII